MNRNRVGGLVALTSVVSLVVSWAGPAKASCAEMPPLPRAVAEAEILFVGTVTETTNRARWAVVSVEEVWKGENIPDVVQIRAGPADPAGPMMSASSVDRSFKDGRRYLFFPYGRKDAVLQDNICTSTRVFTERLTRFRPEAAAAPEPGDVGPDDFDSGTIPSDGVVAIVGALIAGLAAAFGIRKLIAGK